MKGKLLIIDDDESTCELLEMGLRRLGYDVTSRTSPREGLELVAEQDLDVVLSDLAMDEMSGIEMCRRIAGTRPDVPVIVITGMGTMESVVAALRAGAYDFVTKPIDVNLLGISVERAVQHRRLRDELRRLRQTTPIEPSGMVVGSSPALQKVLSLVARVAPSDASVLIHGETGTGKELVARLLHEQSGRKGPFVAINCAAVPATLLESELFGHAKGAFTDAKAARQGLFLEAQGGTLFLDEIGELPVELQPKLLRALQERKVRPVGSNNEVPFDSRVVTATNRDLETEVEEKRFRQDLYYRINVVKIDLPPLRERGTDVLHLANHYLQRYASRGSKPALTLSTPAAEKLLRYNWPGNVRELENCMERATALARFDQITVEDLPERVRTYEADRFTVSVDEPEQILTMDELERRYILRVLKLVGGNKSRAAQLLGFDRRTLYRKLERYEESGGGGGGGSSASEPAEAGGER